MPEGRVTNPLVEEFRGGGVPRDIRLLAAEGLLPLKPEDLVELWAALASDADEGVRKAAEGSLSALPAAFLLPILKNRETPVSIPTWVVSRRPEAELREVVLRNTKLPDKTIETLASVLPRTVAEFAIINRTRLLRRTSLVLLRRLRETLRIGEAEAPPIPSAAPPEPRPSPHPEDGVHTPEDPVRQAAKLLEKAKRLEAREPSESEHQLLIHSAIQLLELALVTLRGKARLHAQMLLARANAKNPEGARRAEELLLDASRENPQSPEPWALLSALYADRGLHARAMSMHNKARELDPQTKTAPRDDVSMTEAEAIVHYLSEEELPHTEMVSAVQRIYRLNTAEKVITAVHGTREERAILVRDTNRLVAVAVLGSPRIRHSEIEAISGMKSVSKEVLGYIGNHPEWAKLDTVIARLLRNPHTPRSTSLSLLARLDPSGLTSVALDKSLPEGVRMRARELADSNAPGRAEAAEEDWEAMVRRVEALIAIAKRSADAVEGKVTGEDGRRILKAIETAAETLKTQGQAEREDLDELEGLFLLTRDEQEELLRLLGFSIQRVQRKWPTPSTKRPTTHGGTHPPTPSEVTLAMPMPSARRQRWCPQAAHTYEMLVRARLRAQECICCDSSLDTAAIVETCGGFSTLPDEFQLTDAREACLVAATDDLAATCSHCGTRNEVLGGRAV